MWDCFPEDPTGLIFQLKSPVWSFSILQSINNKFLQLKISNSTKWRLVLGTETFWMLLQMSVNIDHWWWQTCWTGSLGKAHSKGLRSSKDKHYSERKHGQHLHLEYLRRREKGSCGCGVWEPGLVINNHSEWLSADVMLSRDLQWSSRSKQHEKSRIWKLVSWPFTWSFEGKGRSCHLVALTWNLGEGKLKC